MILLSLNNYSIKTVQPSPTFNYHQPSPVKYWNWEGLNPETYVVMLSYNSDDKFGMEADIAMI